MMNRMDRDGVHRNTDEVITKMWSTNKMYQSFPSFMIVGNHLILGKRRKGNTYRTTQYKRLM
jgi:hypothetical protein